MVEKDIKLDELIEQLRNSSVSDAMLTITDSVNDEMADDARELNLIFEHLDDRTHLDSGKFFFETLNEMLKGKIQSDHLTDISITKLRRQLFKLFLDPERTEYREDIVGCISILIDCSINSQLDWQWGRIFFFDCLVGSCKQHGKESACQLLLNTHMMDEKSEITKQTEMIKFAVEEICFKFSKFRPIIPTICKKFKSILSTRRDQKNTKLTYELSCIILRLAEKAQDLPFMTECLQNLLYSIDKVSEITSESVVITTDVLLRIIEDEKNTEICCNKSMEVLACISEKVTEFHSLLISRCSKILRVFIRHKYLESIKIDCSIDQGKNMTNKDSMTFVEISFDRILRSLSKQNYHEIITNEIYEIVSIQHFQNVPGVIMAIHSLVRSQSINMKVYLPQFMGWIDICTRVPDESILKVYINTISTLISVYGDGFIDNFYFCICFNLYRIGNIFSSRVSLYLEYFQCLEKIIANTSHNILEICFNQTIEMIISNIQKLINQGNPNCINILKKCIQILNALIKSEQELVPKHINDIRMCLVHIAASFSSFPYTDYYIEWINIFDAFNNYKIRNIDTIKNMIQIIASIDLLNLIINYSNDQCEYRYHMLFNMNIKFLLFHHSYIPVAVEYTTKTLKSLIDIDKKRDQTIYHPSFLDDIIISKGICFKLLNEMIHHHDMLITDTCMQDIFELTIDAYPYEIDKHSIYAIHQLWKYTMIRKYAISWNMKFMPFERICDCVSSSYSNIKLILSVYECIEIFTTNLGESREERPSKKILISISKFFNIVFKNLQSTWTPSNDPNHSLYSPSRGNLRSPSYFNEFLNSIIKLNLKLFKIFKDEYISYFNIYRESVISLLDAEQYDIVNPGLNLCLNAIRSFPSEYQKIINDTDFKLIKLLKKDDMIIYKNLFTFINEILQIDSKNSACIIKEAIKYTSNMFDDKKMLINQFFPLSVQVCNLKLDIITICPLLISNYIIIPFEWIEFFIQYISKGQYSNIRVILLFLAKLSEDFIEIFSLVNTEDLYRCFDKIISYLRKYECKYEITDFIEFLKNFENKFPKIYKNWKGRNDKNWKKIQKKKIEFSSKSQFRKD